jgi:succinate dehydrogenase hydrophobic membrane anchor protein
MAEKLTKWAAWGWFLQRITAILLGFFLIVHTQVLHFTPNWKLDFNVVTQRIQSSSLWVIFYGLFVPIGLFHALNGVWQVLHDYRPNPGLAKSVKVFFWIIGLAVSVWGLVVLSKWTS